MTEAAFTAAVSENSARLYSLALSYTRCADDANDILQNTFIKLWNRQERFEDAVSMQKWLTRVCVNECKSYLRSPFRRRTVSLAACQNAYQLDKDADYDLLAAVMRLPQKERVAIHLFYFEGYQISEIAATLRTKEATVKTRLRRARAHLKTMLGDDYCDEL
ncbi:MAG: sigma-70 family RNA polymerase sigma factor [Eubacterium sp.]|nr:sigma-70 family RNA polymerase sigma factor [Eubacterium sp.]